MRNRLFKTVIFDKLILAFHCTYRQKQLQNAGVCKLFPVNAAFARYLDHYLFRNVANENHSSLNPKENSRIYCIFLRGDDEQARYCVADGIACDWFPRQLNILTRTGQDPPFKLMDFRHRKCLQPQTPSRDSNFVIIVHYDRRNDGRWVDE